MTDAAQPTPEVSLASDSVLRNTGLALAVQATGAAFTAVLTLYLVRALAPAGYGTLTLAIAVGALFALPTDFGISSATQRFVAEHRGDRREIAGVLADALLLKLLISTLVVLVLFVSAPLIASGYGSSSLTWPLRGAAIAVFGQTFMMLVGGAFVAQGRVSRNLSIVFSESAVETVSSVLLVALGAGVVGAAFGRALGYATGGAVALVLLWRVFGGDSSDVRRVSRAGMRRLGLYAGALAVVEGAVAVFSRIDAILIGVFLSTSAVGLFEAPMRLIVLLHYVGYAVATGVAPRLARHRSETSRAETFVSALRYLIVFQAALLAPLVVWARPIVELLLGRAYGGSVSVLRVLAGYVFLAGLAPLLSLGANYLGEARRRIPIALATVVVNVILDIVLIPRVGVAGAAAGTDIAFTLYVVAHLWICSRLLAVPLLPLFVTFIRSLAAAAAMAGVLLLTGTSDLSAANWLTGAVGGVLAFGVMLLSTGEFSRLELGMARTAVTRWLPRRV